MKLLAQYRGAALAVRVTLSALAAACSFDRAPIERACVQGRSEACACGDGSLGASVCTADGAFGACSCDAPSSDGRDETSTPPSGGAAGVAGSASGGAGGEGAPPLVDEGAGHAELDAATDTENGDGDASADAAAGDGAIAEELKPQPGEAYGACRSDGSCDAPLFCALGAALGEAENYCTAFCSVSGLGTACPAHPSGAAVTCVSNVCAR